jgi:hypothetical protein
VPEDLTLLAREEDYEVALPEHWTKKQLPDGNWILTSTKAPETLRIRVLVPQSGVVNDPQVAAKGAAEGLSSGMTSHTLVRSEWVDTNYSITGTGTSVPHQELLAYRVLANDKKVVWALHEVSIGGSAPVRVDSLVADPTLNNHRLALLATLKLR